ncbi:MAG: signal peptidase I [Byssovorax sp.]
MAPLKTIDDTFFATWQSAALRPGELQEHDPAAPRRWGPLLFAITVGAVSLSGGLFFEALLVGASTRSAGLFALGVLVASPLIVAVSAYASAIMAHLWLRLLGGAHRPFRDTFASVCYATAPALFNVIPLLGGLISSIWQLCALVIGLRRAQRTSFGRALFATVMSYGTSVVLAVALALGIRVGVVEAFKIPSGAMMPSLMIGDHVFVTKIGHAGAAPRRGEVVVFRFPENRQQDFVKRAISLPGDTLEVIEGRPIINGLLLPHCRVGTFDYEGRRAEMFVEYLEDRAYLTLFDANPDELTCKDAADCGAGSCRGGICGVLQGPYHVPPGETWVMGDNRNNSHDSRSWRGGRGGGVPFDDIKGRVSLVWMSFGPHGGVAQDRLFVDLNKTPVVPGTDAALQVALARCLSERPPVASATPPPGEKR